MRLEIGQGHTKDPQGRQPLFCPLRAEAPAVLGGHYQAALRELRKHLSIDYNVKCCVESLYISSGSVNNCKAWNTMCY